MNFELMWRFEALKIAAMEQLQYGERLVIDELFERAHQIYDSGYEFEMHKWHSEWSSNETEEAEEETPVTGHEGEAELPPAREGYKRCPKCGEEVLEAWKEHKYRKDMTPCGHKW